MVKTFLDFLAVSEVKNPSANAEDTRDESSIPGSGRSPGKGNGNPLQCPCLENPMVGGAWWATLHGIMRELDMPERLNSNKPALMDCGSLWGSSRVSTHLLLLSLFSHRVVSDSETLRNGLYPSRFLCSWSFPVKNTGVCSHFLFQGIFLTQGLNPGVPHCRQTL